VTVSVTQQMSRLRQAIQKRRFAFAPATGRAFGMKRQRFNNFVALLTILGLLVLVAVTATILISENRGAAARALEAQNVPTNIMRVMNLLQRAESSQRGFLLTTDPDYLALYEDSKTRLVEAYENLRLSVVDDAHLGRDFAALSNLVNAKLIEMDEVLALFQGGDRASAYARVRSDEGKSYMDHIRDIVGRMWMESQRQSGAWVEQWQANSKWLFGVQIGAALLVLAVSAIAGIGAIRYLRALERSEYELRLANESLEARVKARTADLEEVNEEVQKFAYIISHDLRSPLVNIMGFSSELSEIRGEIADRFAAGSAGAETSGRDFAEIDGEFTEALTFIQQSANKMDRLISAILKLARSGQREFRFEKLPMAAILGDIVAASKHRASELGAEIIVEDVPPVVGDRLAIEQIFSNLIDNALKYLSDARPGRIVVRGRRQGTKIAYEIEDNGRGIAEHDMVRIFELFRRGGKQDMPGYGIGLAHLRILVRRLGGKITCRSELGKGSIFTVLLPQNGETK
jgi:signal transduction histidine kinase